RVAGVRVARVLHAGSWQGHRLLVQEPLPVPARPAGADRSRRLTDAMVAVASTGDAGPAPLASLGWWRRTGDAADALPAGVVATALRAARDALAGQQARVLR